MLLETRAASVTKPDSELNDMGYDNIDGMNLPVTSILSTQGKHKDLLVSGQGKVLGYKYLFTHFRQKKK